MSRPAHAARRCDTLIAGGVVIDGSGAPRAAADVAIHHGRILALGDLRDWESGERVDAGGLVVAPGFIDVHTHDDRALLESPAMTPKVSQGVTTVVTGNCGVSLAPLQGEPPPPLNLLGGREWYRFARFADYRAELEATPPAVNVAPLVGHSTLRVAVMDDPARAASPAEIGRMARLLEEALQAGCIGMSTGLAYATARAAPAAEVIALAALLAERDAIYTTHMRDEGDRVVESVRETLETAQRAGVAVVISHHKACGRDNYGRTRETLALIDAAAAHQRVAFDVYPYVASSTVLLQDYVEESEKVLITWSTPHPEAAGRDLAEIAAAWGCAAQAAVARLQPAGAIYYQMDEADLRRVLGHPRAMIGSDGLPHDAHPHPRLWGTFARVLGHYAREQGLFSLEQAVYRMSGRPAEVFGLAGRGAVRAGAAADLVLFDPDTVLDRADFADPTRPAAGIREVRVNGASVWRDGAATGARPGRLLERASAPAT